VDPALEFLDNPTEFQDLCSVDYIEVS